MKKEYGAKEVYNLYVFDERTDEPLFEIETSVKYGFGLHGDAGYFTFKSCLVHVDLLNDMANGRFTLRDLRLVAHSKIREVETGKDSDATLVIHCARLHSISVEGSNNEVADTVLGFDFDIQDVADRPNFRFIVSEDNSFSKK